jgi:hypothetical protein
MKINLFESSNKGRFTRLNILQWVLPLVLGITAFIFESIEHGVEDELHYDLAFASEILIFGLLGPLCIGLIISWMRHLMAAEKQAVAEINVLNHELENKIVDRTAALEQRNTELDKANHELHKLDEMKSEFVSLVSHELRAPLTAINGGLEVALQSADSLSPSSRRTLEAMMDESARLTEFVQTILDVSRLEAGRLNLNLGPVAVASERAARSSGICPPRSRPSGLMKSTTNRSSATCCSMPINTPLPKRRLRSMFTLTPAVSASKSPITARAFPSTCRKTSLSASIVGKVAKAPRPAGDWDCISRKN